MIVVDAFDPLSDLYSLERIVDTPRLIYDSSGYTHAVKTILFKKMIETTVGMYLKYFK